MPVLQLPVLPPSTKTLALSRRSPRSFPVRCRHSDFYDTQLRPANGYTPPGAADQSRLFVGYSIYKGKAVLTVEPRAPEFAPVDSGGHKLSKEGIVMLKFVPALSSRQYDWDRRQYFSLSVGEIATIMCLGAKDSCEFFHDPFMGKSDEGKVRKTLKAEPLPDFTGHFFNLNVQNRIANTDENIYIPITRAELTVITSSFNYIIPYLLGWHAFTNTIKSEETPKFYNARSGSELEWSR